MQIKKYGVVLERLELADIELVREWRNSDLVRPFMHYQGVISSQMQINWFNSLNPSTNLYFIIIKDGIKIGLINLKDIKHNLKTAEAGIFIGVGDFLNTNIPVLATIALMEFAFEILGLESLKAKMATANTKVIEFNRNLGYIREEYQTDNDFHYYQVKPHNFNNAILRMKETLLKLKEGSYEVNMSTEEKMELLIQPLNLKNQELRFTIQN